MDQSSEYDSRIPENLTGQEFINAYQKLQQTPQHEIEQLPPETTSPSRGKNRDRSLPIRSHRSLENPVERKIRHEQLKVRPIKRQQQIEEEARHVALERLAESANQNKQNVSRDGRTLSEIGNNLKQGSRTVVRKVNNFLDSDTSHIRQNIQNLKGDFKQVTTKIRSELKQTPVELITDAYQGIRETRPKKVARQLWRETLPFREVTGKGLQSFENMDNSAIGLERSPHEDQLYITSAGTKSKFIENRGPGLHEPKSWRTGNLHSAGLGTSVDILDTGLNFGFTKKPKSGIGQTSKSSGLTYRQSQRPRSPQRSPLFGNHNNFSSGNFGSVQYGAPKQPAMRKKLEMLQQPVQESTPPELPKRNNYNNISVFSELFGNGSQLASKNLYASNVGAMTGGEFGRLHYIQSYDETPPPKNDRSYAISNKNVLSGLDVLMGDQYRSSATATSEQVPQSEKQIIQGKVFPTERYSMSNKTRSTNRNAKRPFTNRAQGGTGIPPIPYEIRVQFPALRARYEIFRNLNDQELWLYLLELRRQQIQRQQGGMSFVRPLMQNISVKKPFNGISSGMFRW